MTVRPRQTWTPDFGLREAQDAERAAVARALAVPLLPFGPVARVIRSDSPVRHSEITLVDPTDGALVLTLPKASAALAGAVVTIVNDSDSTNDITIVGDGRDTIDGQVSITYDVDQCTVQLACLGPGKWKLIGHAIDAEWPRALVYADSYASPLTAITARGTGFTISNATTVTAFASKFTVDASLAKITYTGKRTREFSFLASLSGELSAANHLVHATVGKNGSVISDDLECDHSIGTATDHTPYFLTWFGELEENDSLEVMMASDGSYNWELEHLIMSVMRAR